MRAARICSRDQRLCGRPGLVRSRWCCGPGISGEGFVAVISPVGLNEDAVDLFEVHGADLVAHRLDQSAEAEVASAAQEALGGTDDEGQRVGAKGVVPQAGAVQ